MVHLEIMATFCKIGVEMVTQVVGIVVGICQCLLEMAIVIIVRTIVGISHHV